MKIREDCTMQCRLHARGRRWPCPERKTAAPEVVAARHGGISERTFTGPFNRNFTTILRVLSRLQRRSVRRDGFLASPIPRTGVDQTGGRS